MQFSEDPGSFFLFSIHCKVASLHFAMKNKRFENKLYGTRKHVASSHSLFYPKVIY